MKIGVFRASASSTVASQRSSSSRRLPREISTATSGRGAGEVRQPRVDDVENSSRSTLGGMRRRRRRRSETSSALNGSIPGNQSFGTLQ
jgi:hypothetical protein